MICVTFVALLASLSILSTSSATEGNSRIQLFAKESDAEKKQRFEAFKGDFRKSYKDSSEDDQKYNVFLNNLARIDDLNLAAGSMVHGVTQFSDITNAEFQAKYLTPRATFQAQAANLRSNAIENAQDNEKHGNVKLEAVNVDWSAAGRTTAIKNQGGCGSCWAFGITEQIESDAIRLLSKTYILAPQQVVDCDTSNLGCNGGNEAPALTYVKNAGGICLEADYPYTSGGTQTAGTCKTSVVSTKKVVTISSYTRILGESSVATFVTNTGPVTIAVDATTWDTYPSSGPIWSTSQCPASASSKLNHVVQLVGLYIPSSGQSYWKIRNQWGTSWGSSGYMYITYGTNTCGMSSDYSYYSTPVALGGTASSFPSPKPSSTTPTFRPTASTSIPTFSTRVPTGKPTTSTVSPSNKPTALPTQSTVVPTGKPVVPGSPSFAPTASTRVPTQSTSKPTAMPTTSTVKPSAAPSPTTPANGWMCPAYSFYQWTSNQYYLYSPCFIYACSGATITATSCSPGGVCSGDSEVFLWAGSGADIAWNDDSPDCAAQGCMCSKLVYTVPANSGCKTYTLGQSCYPDTSTWFYDHYSCAGQFMVTGGTQIYNSPGDSGATTPTPPLSRPIAPGSSVHKPKK